ncbi:Short-chain dehydrogenase/reductase SDR [Sphingomonas paucimobilis]|nr:Short-chain dehydrogenase/reductase SDR [Sphingomonas paucimobilis]
MESKRRTAVVTGAGRGIGLAVAQRLLEEGWNVALAARRIDAETAGHTGGNVLPVVCDVTSAQDVDRLFAEVTGRWGRVDLLFNNAGMGTPLAPPDEIPVDNWEQVIATNLMGAILCARAAFGVMRRQDPAGGRIINNGSVAASVPRPGSGPYTVSKHGITGLTKSLALDGRPFGIACGQIDIGNVRTDMTAAVAVGLPQADGSLRPEPMFDLPHVVDAVSYMANLPLSVNVPFVTVMATNMPLMGRG